MWKDKNFSNEIKEITVTHLATLEITVENGLFHSFVEF